MRDVFLKFYHSMSGFYSLIQHSLFILTLHITDFLNLYKVVLGKRGNCSLLGKIISRFFFISRKCSTFRC